MSIPILCTSLEEVRAHIDAIDRSIVTLLAERGRFVAQAARFKKSADDVKAPQRVEQVLSKVRVLAEELGAHPDVTESVYRAMIGAFIDAELAEHAKVTSGLQQETPTKENI